MNRALMLTPLLFTLTLTPVLADPVRSCFSVREYDSWRAQDSKTIFIRAGHTRYYRLDLGAACPLATDKGAHLMMQVSGSDEICSAADWDLRFSRDTMGSLPSHCIVKTMTPLTQAETDAIPKEFKPQ